VTVQRVLDLIDQRLVLLLNGVGLARCVFDFLLGLTGPAISHALRFEVFIAGHDSGGLLSFARYLIKLRTHRAPSQICRGHNALIGARPLQHGAVGTSVPRAKSPHASQALGLRQNWCRENYRTGMSHPASSKPTPFGCLNQPGLRRAEPPAYSQRFRASGVADTDRVLLPNKSDRTASAPNLQCRIQ
jgi:hypothetical protein